MALLLNIETATEVCSVALGSGAEVLDLEEDREPFQHASRLTVLISDLLKRNNLEFKEIDAIAVSSGPGSYTGLRIGASVAKGLCYALDVPLISVSTLQALAFGTIKMMKQTGALYGPAIDARRNEVYTALYDYELNEVLSPRPLILEEFSYAKYLDVYKIYFGGNGSEKISTIINHKNAEYTKDVFCSAGYMVTISNVAYIAKKFENLIYFEPRYLKDFKEKQK